MSPPRPRAGLPALSSLVTALCAFAALFVGSAAAAGAPARWDVVASPRDGNEPLLRLAAREAARYLRLLRCGAGAASAACVRLQVAGAAGAAVGQDNGSGAGSGVDDANMLLVVVRIKPSKYGIQPVARKSTVLRGIRKL